MNVTLNSQQVKTMSERDAQEFEYALEAIAAELPQINKASEVQVKDLSSHELEEDSLTGDEAVQMVLQYKMVQTICADMKKNHELMQEILDEV
ncbi:hypothetical protein [Shewanella sp. WE21]|jgi:hypothetical protein|uniref:hypothetical protein n=1 Tax=Shewanella sp. WE21 TaxID=2029986 RepID=UPI00131A2E8D|nr:hypothetical protein [Shewanella sp. WE21]